MIMTDTRQMTQLELASELLTMLEVTYLVDCEDRNASVMIFSKPNGMRLIELAQEIERRAQCSPLRLVRDGVEL